MVKRKAFTLMELLVVIAIISLLLSIMLPSLQKVKKIAKLVICKSNQRQIHTAWHMYAVDHEDLLAPGRIYYPSEIMRPGESWVVCFWPYRYQGYLKNVSRELAPTSNIWKDTVMWCPAGDGIHPNAYEAYYYFNCYAQNGIIGGEYHNKSLMNDEPWLVTCTPANPVNPEPAKAKQYVRTKYSQIKRPSDVFCWVDAGFRGRTVLDWANPAIYIEEAVVRRHDGKANFMMADGANIENKLLPSPSLEIKRSNLETVRDLMLDGR